MPFGDVVHTRREYYKAHLPVRCDCTKQEFLVFREVTDSEVTGYELLQKLSDWNRAAQGHWQYWTTALNGVFHE